MAQTAHPPGQDITLPRASKATLRKLYLDEAGRSVQALALALHWLHKPLPGKKRSKARKLALGESWGYVQYAHDLMKLYEMSMDILAVEALRR